MRFRAARHGERPLSPYNGKRYRPRTLRGQVRKRRGSGGIGNRAGRRAGWFDRLPEEKQRELRRARPGKRYLPPPKP